MSMYACLECGKPVSTDAIRCLGCGACGTPSPADSAGRAIFFVGSALLVCLAAAGAFVVLSMWN